MDILLFGGSFDPVHNGHYSILETALEYKEFDKIIIMPVGTPGHKAGCKVPFAIRKLMAETAFSKLGVDMEVSSFEGESTERSYSYITVDYLKSLYPGASIYFVIGADSAVNMKTWKKWEYLAQNVTFLVFARDYDDRSLINRAVEEIKVYSPKTTVLKSRVVPVSSTQLRDMIAAEEDFSRWVDGDVAKIIKANHLYAADYYERNLGTARLLVPLMLREKRAQHAFNVEKLAARLAEKYGVDVKKARLAALLHDIMKQADESIMLHRAMQSDIIKRIKGKPVPVLHGFAAADYACREMQIDDSETLMAIKSHTCGRPGMSDLEKVIYLADMLSEERSYPEKENLLKLAWTDLDIAMEQALTDSINWLKEKNGVIDSDSYAALEYFTRLNHGGNTNG
ncbi:MAG: nicotinate (nicotinamide) nucleotide adenylyltransferase [Oscillospiraceae bacterium]|nr:nicotinate (nicotinamide) nucleotide adenylyltransferase [Oscillospiraceae bacterium]